MSHSTAMVVLLAVLQALLLTSNVVTMLLGGPIGASLAPGAAWATVPITTFIVGAALSAMPASLLMKEKGRRFGFMLGTVIGFAGAGVCLLALSHRSFALFCAGTFLVGSYNAFGQYYRLAAAEVVGEADRGRAIAYVLGGGLFGAFLGPWSATETKDLFGVVFAGPYLVLMICAALSFVLLILLRIPIAAGAGGQASERPRPLAEIVAQPRFLAAVLGAVTGYAVMNFLMTATPLAMHAHHHGDHETAFVFQWHVIAMFAPSFFSGALIVRYGAVRVMGWGALFMLASVAFAYAGTSLVLFWTALFCLGIGWNFLYVGGTSLLVTCHRADERGKVQGLNDLLVFAATGASSLLSGMFLHYAGWETMTLATLPLIGVTLVTLFWVRARGGAAVPAR